MNFKIDTKEKFTTITSMQIDLSDNLTEELIATATRCLLHAPKNVILNLSTVQHLTETGAHQLATLQETFYEKNASLVVCALQTAVEQLLEQWQLNEVINIVPTESEAWDIVQMEEIERELMDDFDELTNE